MFRVVEGGGLHLLVTVGDEVGGDARGASRGVVVVRLAVPPVGGAVSTVEVGGAVCHVPEVTFLVGTFETKVVG